MFETRNKKILRNISMKDFFSNLKRNLLLLASIILCQMILIVLINASSNYILSLHKQKLSVDGMDYQAVLTSPTQQQLKLLEENATIKYSGQQIACATGIAVNENTTVKIVLKWKDSINWEKQTLPALVTTQGRYPEKLNEIMMSESALRDAAIKDIHLGMNIPMKYVDKEGTQEAVFTLSGIFKDTTELNGVSTPSALVSKLFLNNSGYKDSTEESSKVYINFNSIFVKNSTVESLKKELKLSNNQVFLYDDELAVSTLFIVIGSVLLILLVLLVTYLVIFNIMYISLVKDTKVFGLYRAIGMTFAQIKSLFMYQLMGLLILGLPIGLGLGIFFSNLLQLSHFELNGWNSIGIVFSCVFVSFTTYISLNFPLKIAMKHTVIETKGINFQKNKNNGKRNRLKGTSLFSMANRNIFRDKRRAILVILSLFLALTTFITINTLIYSRNDKDFVDAYMENDMILNNQTGSGEEEYPKQVFSNEMINDISSQSGIRNFNKISFSPMVIKYDHEKFYSYLDEYYQKYMRMTAEEGEKRIGKDPNSFYGFLIGIGENDYKKLKKNLTDEIDDKEFYEGKVGILNTDIEQVSAFTNTTVNLRTDGQELNIKVVAVSDKSLSDKAGIAPNIYLYEESLGNMDISSIYEKLSIDFDSESANELNEKIKKIVSKDSSIGIVSKIDIQNEMKSSIEKITLMSNTLIFLFALIAMINFVNVVTAGIVEREKEFSVLESIGMTKKQIRKMLVIESLEYLFLSIIATICIGIPISYLLFNIFKEDYMHFIVPIKLLLIILSSILLVGVVIPILSFGRKKENISVRLRG